MFEASILTTFVLASIIILVVPGPTVTVIIANSLQHGSKAGLLNIAGTQLGLLLMLIPLAAGFEVITVKLAWLFEWLRYVGAAYLIWLGYKLLRSNGSLGKAQNPGEASKSNRSFFWQGFLVILSNPKILFFFGAFLPQFIDETDNVALQTMVLGVIFMVLATFLDCCYAIAAGKAGKLLTKKRVRTVELAGGFAMIGGGAWLALNRA